MRSAAGYGRTKKTARVPVIMITALDKPGDREMGSQPAPTIS